MMFSSIGKGGALVFVGAFLLGMGACTAESPAPEGLGAAAIDTRAVYADAEGVLHFASHDAFYETIDAIGQMSEPDLDAWERDLGFVSYRRAFEDVMAKAVNAASPEEADAILRANDDIVVVKGEDANPRVEALGYSAVIDREGLFYVAGVVHKVLPEFVISAEDGRVETIDATLASMGELGLSLVVSMSTPAPGVRVFRYAGDNMAHLESVAATGCGVNYVSAYKDTSDRKADFEMRTWTYYCTGCCGNYYNQVKAEAKLRGYKKNIWGNWKSYKTTYECRSVEAVIKAPKVSDFDGVKSVFTYQLWTIQKTSASSGGEYETWTCGLWNVGNQVQNASIIAPKFEKAKGQGKSRGTGTNNWAQICCGYVDCNFPQAEIETCSPRTVCLEGECGLVDDGCGGTMECGLDGCGVGVQCPDGYEDCGDWICCTVGTSCGGPCLAL